ncbi:Cof-type HAD-IIB family hydrolase, partial [Sutcliffiella cohnii]|nr:Cof-type HAD-IIB family hydrolase [Sutcliffiella cohnii]
KIADHVTDTKMNDGVAKVVDELVLKNFVNV